MSLETVPASTACPSYPPALYAAVHTGNPGDAAYYQRAAAGARSVLELGCGYGRILEALTELPALEVHGLDRDPGLLELAAQRAPKALLARGDMRRFELDRRFDRVFIPYNGVYCLASEADFLEMLGCVRAHLEPGGLLVFDAYAADAFHEEAEDDDGWDEPTLVKTVRALGDTWDVYERSRWDRDAQRIDARYTHVAQKDAREVEAAIPQRYLRTAELTELLQRGGFDLVALQGGFDQVAYDESSPLFIAIATPIGAEG